MACLCKSAHASIPLSAHTPMCMPMHLPRRTPTRTPLPVPMHMSMRMSIRAPAHMAVCRHVSMRTCRRLRDLRDGWTRPRRAKTAASPFPVELAPCTADPFSLKKNEVMAAFLARPGRTSAHARLRPHVSAHARGNVYAHTPAITVCAITTSRPQKRLRTYVCHNCMHHNYIPPAERLRTYACHNCMRHNYIAP